MSPTDAPRLAPTNAPDIRQGPTRASPGDSAGFVPLGVKQPSGRTPVEEVNEAVEAIRAHLPERIGRLISPEVLSARTRVIQRKSNDLTAERVGRRRCAEIIANHLLQTTTHAA